MNKIERRTCGFAKASIRCVVYACMIMAVVMVIVMLGVRLVDTILEPLMFSAVVVLMLAAPILGAVSLVRISLSKGILKGKLFAIIGIVLPVLFALSAPGTDGPGSRERAKAAVTIGELKSIKTAAQAYKVDTSNWPVDGASDVGFVKNKDIKSWNGPYLEKWPVRAMWGGNYIFHNDGKFGWSDIGKNGKVIYIEVTNVPIEMARKIDKWQDGEVNLDKGSIRYRNGSLYFLIDISMSVGQDKAQEERLGIWIDKINGLHKGQDKEDVLRLMGQPDWESSGRNAVAYYDRNNGKMLRIGFDSKSKLMAYGIVKTSSFPESPVKQLTR
jgi:general secretion pathway protein G